MRMFVALANLTFILAFATACSHKDETADNTPLPTAAAPPYICQYIPRRAVEQMTGLRDLVVKGSFDLEAADGNGIGSCTIHRPSEEQEQVLEVALLVHSARNTEEEIRLGAKRLPTIIPGSDGYYGAKKFLSENPGAVAVLNRGVSTVVVDLSHEVAGRDPEADVLALMKIVAPKLINESSTITPSPSIKKGS